MFIAIKVNRHAIIIGLVQNIYSKSCKHVNNVPKISVNIMLTLNSLNSEFVNAMWAHVMVAPLDNKRAVLSNGISMGEIGSIL